MKASQAFKQYRENTGKSMRRFASEAGITLNRLICYENGTTEITEINVEHAVSIFGLLGVSIDEFIDLYFPEIKEEIAERSLQWKSEHPRDYSAKNLRKKYRNRIARLLERKRITEEEYADLFVLFQECFARIDFNKDRSGNISDQYYEEYILPLSCSIRKRLSKQAYSDIIADRIDQCILSSDYKYNDVDEIIGVSFFPLRNCRSNPERYRKLQLKTAIRLCYVLGKSFREIYLDGIQWA